MATLWKQRGRKASGLKLKPWKQGFSQGSGATERKAIMYTPSVIFLQKMWYMWASIFSPIPYGDPYIAFVALFFVLIGFSALILNINFHRTSMKKYSKNEDRLKTWCKVMNIY
jgi:hypothetical protein